MVDYFSRWPEVRKLSSTTSKGVIEAFKSIFSGQGIPQTLISDNGPQFPRRNLQDSLEHTISPISLVAHITPEVMGKLKGRYRQSRI